MGRPRGSKTIDESKFPGEIRRCVAFYKGLGKSSTTSRQLRSVLCHYFEFCKELGVDRLDRTNWKHFEKWRAQLMNNGIKKSTVRVYMTYAKMYYAYKAKSNLNNARLFNLYEKIKLIDIPSAVDIVHYEPLDLDDVKLMLKMVEQEDYEVYAFLMTLLYTGGRAQFYGLRVSSIDFEKDNVNAKVKRGKYITIPLHPELATVLKKHLKTRDYESEFLFRYGRDPDEFNDQQGNAVNAYRYCQRAKNFAGIKDNPNPHRWRDTLATHGRDLGLDPQYVQVIMGHTSIATTLDFYSRPNKKKVKDAFSQISFVEGNKNDETDISAQLDKIVDLVPSNIKKPIAGFVQAMKDLIAAANGGS